MHLECWFFTCRCRKFLKFLCRYELHYLTLYQLVSSMQAMQVDMRTTQLAMRTTQIHHDDILYDIQYQLSEHSERVAAIEDELRDWRFYEEHGFYPGPSSPQH